MNLFEVEDIMSHRVNKHSKKEYLIKWVGYGINHSTWEPLKNLQSVHELVNKYERKLRQKESNLLKMHQKTQQNHQPSAEKHPTISNTRPTTQEGTQNNYIQGIPQVASSFSQLSEHKSDELQKKEGNDNIDCNEDSSEIKAYVSLDLALQQGNMSKKVYKLPRNYHKLKDAIKLIGVWVNEKGKKNYVIKYGQDITLYCYREYIISHYYRELIDYLQDNVQFTPSIKKRQ